MKHFLTVLTAGLLCLALVGCHKSTFDGSRTSDEYSFRMDYTLLDRQESASLTLGSGDALRVTLAQESGSVDVTVGIEGKEPIYEGHRLTDAVFVLNISEAGAYQISVTGHGACGSVTFTKTGESSAAESSGRY